MSENEVSDSGDMKFVLAFIRFFQFSFATTIAGSTAWFHGRLIDAGYNRIYRVDVPLGFSVAAIWISALAVISYIFHSAGTQVIVGIFDLVLFGGFIASAVAYSSFNIKCSTLTLVRIIQTVGSTSCGTVRLVAALLILQIVLFLCSAILQFALASRLHHPQARHITEFTTTDAPEQRRWYSLKRGHDERPDEIPAEAPPTV